MKKTQPPLILPIVAYSGIEMFDTSNIKTADEYLILRNLFSPLFDTADNGEIQGVLAESSQWRNDSVHIRLRDGLKTRDGQPITAHDAAFTLKRLLVLGKNTHARLGDVFPNCRGLESAFDDCPDISVQEPNTLVLRPANEKIWLLDTLTSQDFAVIPRGSVDPQTLAIRDYRNTSGPYFVRVADPETGFIAAANESHPLFENNPDHPQEVQFKAFPTQELGSLPEKFISGEFNYYPKYFIPSGSQIAKIMSSNLASQINLHETELNFTRVLRFTPRGLKTLNLSQRFALGNALTAAYQNHFSAAKASMIPALSFYSPTADGALSAEEIKEIQDIRQSAKDSLGQINTPLVAGCFEGSKSSIERAIDPKAHGFELVEYSDVLENRKSTDKTIEEPHFYITAMDADPKASLSGVTNVIHSKYFQHESAEIDAWLRSYAQEPSKRARLDMLKKAHFHALRSAYLIPIYSTATALMVQKPWSPEDYPQRNIVDALWLLKNTY